MSKKIENTMKLVIITGPPAVGKMTVGRMLEKITDLRLFHNHMSIELVNKFFDFGTKEFERLDKIIRFEIFKEVAKSKLNGIIFTIVWDFDFEEDEVYIDEIIEVFKKNGSEVYIVELYADLKVRLERNKNKDRLEQKPSKRDLEMSEKSLLHSESEYRMVSKENEFENKSIYKINNKNITPLEAAKMIKAKFNL